MLMKFFWQHWSSNIVLTPYTGGQVGWYTKLAARLLAKKLIGYTDTSKFSPLFYDSIIPLVGRSRAPRLLECDALAAMGVPVAFEQPSFSYIPEQGLLKRFGVEEKQYVVLHLFSGGNARGLSLGRKQELIAALKEKVSLPILLTGSPKEVETLGALPPGVWGVATSLQELAHLIDRAALMVSLDTGAAHMAAHLCKPLIVLASCVGVQWWGNDMYGARVPAVLCTRLDVCKDGHDYGGYAPCLDAIDPHDVANQAAALLTL
jgi:ADP-heptose:LPS heptosyltransferase